MYHVLVTLTFVETPLFSRLLAECVEDTDFRAFQNELLEDPERGDLLVGCRGLRKARMAFAKHGKVVEPGSSTFICLKTTSFICSSSSKSPMPPI